MLVFKAIFPTTRVKPRWNQEEIYIYAKAEAALSKQNVRFMNQELAKHFPDRSVEAIKGMRRKPKYKTMVADLLVSSPVVATSDSIQVSVAATSDPKPPSEPPRRGWHDDLLCLINVEMLTGLNPSEITPGQPNHEKKDR